MDSSAPTAVVTCPSKVMVGLHDPAIKQEVFRRCDSFEDADSLRGFCSTFEAAQSDAAKFTRERAVAGADVTADDVTEEEEPLVAASRQTARPAKHGYRNPPANIPPNTAARQCYNCGEIQWRQDVVPSVHSQVWGVWQAGSFQKDMQDSQDTKGG